MSTPNVPKTDSAYKTIDYIKSRIFELPKEDESRQELSRMLEWCEEEFPEAFEQHRIDNYSGPETVESGKQY